MNNILDITGMDIMSLAKMRTTLLQIDEMFNNDIINETSFDMNDRDWQTTTASQHCDTSANNIRKTITLIDEMIKALTKALTEPDQINEANWDRD